MTEGSIHSTTTLSFPTVGLLIVETKSSRKHKIDKTTQWRNIGFRYLLLCGSDFAKVYFVFDCYWDVSFHHCTDTRFVTKICNLLTCIHMWHKTVCCANISVGTWQTTSSHFPWFSQLLHSLCFNVDTGQVSLMKYNSFTEVTQDTCKCTFAYYIVKYMYMMNIWQHMSC